MLISFKVRLRYCRSQSQRIRNCERDGVCACKCVCERERERVSERGSEREREMELGVRGIGL
jgi:hypothetical protein